MKTIEERANEYADTKVTPYDEPMYNAWRQAIMNDYLAGAKEQKKIDIEKACEWMTNFKTGNGEFPLYDFVGNFRKAMEEEI